MMVAVSSMARLRQLGLPDHAGYGARAAVEEELDYATQLYAERAWYVVDVSGRAIEETATIILEHYKQAGDQRGYTLAPPPEPRSR